MSEAFRRAGILYGRLGLTTPSTLIEGRYPGIKAAAEALTVELLPELLHVLFGRTGAEEVGFLEHFRSDPTFDVRPADKEAALLATAIADYAMTEKLGIAGEIALSVITSALGGMRQPAVASDILTIADETLTAKQAERQEPPGRRNKIAAPADLVQAITNIKGQQPVHTALPAIVPAVTAALEQLNSYTASISQQAANINNSLLAHIAKLEEEMRMHWWVVGGWSAEADSFFRDLDVPQAAVQAGWELAGKTSASLGLHATPALLDMVLNRGRDSLSIVALTAAAKAPTLVWRKAHFGTIAGGPLAPLLPVSTMFGLSADSADEDDWKPAFTRKTGLDPASTIGPMNLAVQVYRERLVRNLLEV
jgi:hypothetical protein